MTTPRPIGLTAGDWSATLLPERGAAFAALTFRGRDVLRPIAPGGDPTAGFHGAFLMAPWTNRLDGGRFVLDGIEHRMPINRPAEGNALHGFVREHAWHVESAEDARATLTCAAARAPFDVVARLEVALSEAGLALSLALRNAGPMAVPMGIGWHPFFARPRGTRLAFGARTVFGRAARGLAVGPRASAGLRGADAVLEGLDTHFAGWDGSATIAWPDGTCFVLEAAGAWSRNLQVFAPRGGDVLCVEPVSHAPDAVNNPAVAAHGAMAPLLPGAVCGGSLRINRG